MLTIVYMALTLDIPKIDGVKEKVISLENSIMDIAEQKTPDAIADLIEKAKGCSHDSRKVAFILFKINKHIIDIGMCPHYNVTENRFTKKDYSIRCMKTGYETICNGFCQRDCIYLKNDKN